MRAFRKRKFCKIVDGSHQLSKRSYAALRRNGFIFLYRSAALWVLCSVAVAQAQTAGVTPSDKSESVPQLSDITVTAPDSAASAKFDDKSSTEGLTESASEITLKNSNAQSAGDYLKDVSGVTVSKGANGTSNVSVRGIDQRMLRITVDGQRQGGAGNPLDNIPAEIVQSLEVTKTFTPDMEADAVGGVININTGGNIIKDAYIQDRNQAIYNAMAPHVSTRNSLTIGQPFALLSNEKNASVMATLSFDDQYAHRERLSVLREWTPQISPGPAPYTGEQVPVLTLPLIESTNEHRQRYGFVLNSDARIHDVVLFWRSNFSRESADRLRYFDDTDPASGDAQYLTATRGVFTNVPLTRRSQDQLSNRDVVNMSFGVKSKVGQNDLDATLSYGSTDESEPHTQETQFLSNGLYRASYDISGNAYAPDFEYIDDANTAGSAAAARDPNRYHLNYFSTTRSDVAEQDGSLKMNVKLNADNGVNYLKFGGKIQQRTRDANIDRDAYGASANLLTMSGLVGQSNVNLDTLPYQFGPVPKASSVADALIYNPNAFLKNDIQTLINSASSDTDMTETLWALYGMGKFKYKNWTFLGGVRFEGTRDESSGNQMLLDDNGVFQGFREANVVRSYVEPLPGIHFRYEPSGGLLYRGSITRTMSRPNSADIAPFRTLSFIDRRSRVGAPDLKPYLSTNYDFSVDKYSDTYGLISAALFYKKIDQFITDAQYPVNIGNLGEFIEFKRVNGDAAYAMGGELSWQSAAWTLPSKLGRGSVEANYNYNHGVAHHATRPGETFPLPRQVDHQASIKLVDARGPLSVDFTLSYRSGWWEDLIAEDFDNYITSAWDAQINGSYKLSKSMTVTSGVSNLLNRPTKHYAGTTSRMNDWQRSGVEFNVGMQIKM